MSQTIAPVLGEATIQELREVVQGEVITPAEDGYVEASAAWNGEFDGRRPALVVRAHGAADVAAGVGFARSNDLPIAVRGGGHSIAGFSTVDDGIVIDLGPMNGGGGNFGIVTQFELQLHPLGPEIYGGPIFYPASASRDLLLAFREWSTSAPDEVTFIVNLTTAPPLPVIPEEWHGKHVAVLVGA